jgi:hypothetical protein
MSWLRRFLQRIYPETADLTSAEAIAEADASTTIAPVAVTAPFAPALPRETAWCAVANVVPWRSAGPGGKIVRRGTKHFRPRAKVFVRVVYWGMGGESLEVVGHHRGSGKLVAMVIRSAWLEHWRVKRVYHAAIIAKLRAQPGTLGTTLHGDGFVAWDGDDASRERAEQIVAAFLRR